MQSDKRDGESDLSIGKGERKLKWLSDHTCSWLSIPIVSATWRRMEFTCWKKDVVFWRISTEIQAEALLQAIQHERNERYKDTHHNSFEKSDLNLAYLCLFVSVFTLFSVFVVDPPLWEIDVTFVFVDSEDGHNLVLTNPHHLVYGTDTSTWQLTGKGYTNVF